jgi:hypothetical protein
VKIDDPRLEKAREELFERIKKYDEQMLTVIKNHLGCEQFLNQLLSAASRKWKGKMCSGKIDIAKTLDVIEIDPKIWKVLEAGNSLRNKIAHGAEDSVIAARMTDFRTAYLAALSPEQAKGCGGLDDMKIVVLAFGLCGAYIVVAAERLTEERKKKAKK